MRVGEYLHLSKAALEREHALDIFGISEVTRQLKPASAFSLAKRIANCWTSLNPDVLALDGAVDQAFAACVIASIN